MKKFSQPWNILVRTRLLARVGRNERSRRKARRRS
jgi:hypothetical protein